MNIRQRLSSNNLVIAGLSAIAAIGTLRLASYGIASSSLHVPVVVKFVAFPLAGFLVLRGLSPRTNTAPGLVSNFVAGLAVIAAGYFMAPGDAFAAAILMVALAAIYAAVELIALRALPPTLGSNVAEAQK